MPSRCGGLLWRVLRDRRLDRVRIESAVGKLSHFSRAGVRKNAKQRAVTPTTTKETKMKKGMILAIVAIAAVAAPAFAVAFHHHAHEQGVGNFTCNMCKGTGRSPGPGGLGTGNMRCSFCQGTGFQGSY